MYPPIEPFQTARIEVSSRHTLYVERSGTEGGIPIFFLHGGPGSCSNPRHRQYFDPACYDIVLFDQRGCGKSTPRGEIAENDTWALVEDINRIKQALGITGRINLFGGSWGSTLALAYAATYPQAVEEMILRGVFLGSRDEIHWFTNGLASFAPDAWQEFVGSGDENLVAQYHEQLNSDDEDLAHQAARRWARYEALTMRIGCAEQTPDNSVQLPDIQQLADRARVQLHYLFNDCFLGERSLLELAPQITVPVTIVQGGLDFICPPVTAWRLSKLLPRASLHLVNDAGHDGLSGKLAGLLTEEADALRDRLRKGHES